MARSLKQEGIITSDGADVVLNVVPASAGGARPTAEAIEDEDEDGATEQHDADAAKALHRNFQKWAQVPALYLRKALSIAKPVSLAFHALKALIPRGSREIPRAVALEIMEFMTDIDPAMDVGDSRTEIDIINIIVAKNLACGRRARELRLIRGGRRRRRARVRHRSGDLLRTEGERRGHRRHDGRGSLRDARRVAVGR